MKKGNIISGAIMGVPLECRNVHVGVSSERRNVHIRSSELRNVHNDCSHVETRWITDEKARSVRSVAALF